MLLKLLPGVYFTNIFLRRSKKRKKTNNLTVIFALLGATLVKCCKIYYLEDELFVLRRGSLQLLLDETRSMLVLRKLDDVIGNVAKLEVRISVVSEIRFYRLKH